jgi:hypothetical protein
VFKIADDGWNMPICEFRLAGSPRNAFNTMINVMQLENLTLCMHAGWWNSVPNLEHKLKNTGVHQLKLWGISSSKLSKEREATQKLS